MLNRKERLERLDLTSAPTSWPLTASTMPSPAAASDPGDARLIVAGLLEAALTAPEDGAPRHDLGEPLLRALCDVLGVAGGNLWLASGATGELLPSSATRADIGLDRAFDPAWRNPSVSKWLCLCLFVRVGSC